jgi:hypothetical protein
VHAAVFGQIAIETIAAAKVAVVGSGLDQKIDRRYVSHFLSG